MAVQVPERYLRDDSEFDRAVAFIDATFAVALTLLVTTLDIKSDPASWDTLAHFYDAMGSQLVAFAISFVVIAMYWVAHYRLVASFGAIDIRLITVNLFLLAAIVILPFTTESAGDPAVDQLPLPAVVLSVNLAAVSIAFTLIYVIARDRGLLRVEHSRASSTGASHCSSHPASSSWLPFRSPTPPTPASPAWCGCRCWSSTPTSAAA